MSIQKNTGDFGGEMTDLFLIPTHHVNFLPETDDSFEMDFDDFDLKSGKNFENIYFSPQTGNFSENQSVEDPGEIFKKNISFKIPKNRSDVTSWLRTRKQYKFIALYRSGDGTWYYAGPQMKIQYMRVIPDSSDKYNGYEISIMGEDKDPSPVILNVDL